MYRRKIFIYIKKKLHAFEKSYPCVLEYMSCNFKKVFTYLPPKKNCKPEWAKLPGT